MSSRWYAFALPPFDEKIVFGMQKPGGVSPFTVGLRLAVITLLLAATTFVCSLLIHVNSTTAGFIYLIVILFIAAQWGLVESTVASVLAVLAFNFFFLPPFGTLTIADPQNWIALLAFLATSITASQLSATVRRQAIQATERQREMEQLYSLSRGILLLDSARSVAQQMAEQIARVFESPAVVLYDKQTGSFHRGGVEDMDDVEENLRASATRGTQMHDSQRGVVITAVRLGAEPIGSLALKTAQISDSALNGLANLAAIAMERAQAYEQASRAEAARQSDQLKSTLLDAIAHEFKTPLTSIKVASTALLSEGSIGPEQRRELLSVVDEETDRLSSLVTEAIQTARLESGKLNLNRRSHSVGELVDRAVRTDQNRRELEVDVSPDAGFVQADGELLGLALHQIVDNAIKYSRPERPVRISARRNNSEVVFSVEDHGGGIAESERTKIFQRFYRSPGVGQTVPGAGLGLAIAKDIVQAHGGKIWVESAEGGGALFQISIPSNNDGADTTAA